MVIGSPLLKAAYVSRRLGKTIVVHTEGSRLRLDPHRWAPFWSAMVHAINNAVDHGIEAADVRVGQGKPAAGTLWLEACGDGSALVVTLRDDGRGIDWPILASRAAATGLAHVSQSDLMEAMFSDGISSRGEATTTSGRGIGLASLRAVTRALGGSVDVHSEPGVGSTFWFRFPGVMERPASPMPRALDIGWQLSEAIVQPDQATRNK